MNKERGFKNVVIVMLLVAVLGLSVAFALFSSQLTVNGTAKVLSAGNNWNVNFSEVSASKGGYATSSGSVADDASATITFDCELSSPDDSCTLNGTIKNSGKIRAKYKGYSLKVGEITETSGTTVTNDDIEVTLTAPVGWEKDEKILNTNDTGLFSLVVRPVSEEVFPDGTSGDKSHTITLTFDFEQAEPES